MAMVQVYRGWQTGARSTTMTNAGFVTNILDDILVNGFCQASVSSITHDGVGTATVTTSTAHSFTIAGCEPCLISGADQAAYNGVFTPQTIISSTQFTISVPGTPVTPATGTIISKHAPVGWTIAYTETNARSYRPPAGNRFYLNIDDNAGSVARARGFETATAVGAAAASGTNPFPLDAQLSGGGYLSHRAYGGDQTQWMVVASQTSVFFLNQISSSNNIPIGHYFGDLVSYKSGDAYHTLFGMPGGDYNGGGTPTDLFSNVTAGANGSMGGHWIARAYTQLVGSTAITKGVDTWRNNATTNTYQMTALWPSMTEGGIILSPFWVSEGANGIRGHVPGVWSCQHANIPLANGTVFNGSVGTALAGKTFMFFSTWNGPFFLEISNTWS